MILEAVISASKLMVIVVSKEKIGIEWLGSLIEVEISFFKRNIEIFDDIRERKACVSNINLIFFFASSVAARSSNLILKSVDLVNRKSCAIVCKRV